MPSTRTAPRSPATRPPGSASRCPTLTSSTTGSSDRERTALMQTSLLASGLGFPEGPAVLGDGRIVFCDGNTGELLAYADGTVSTFARTGGSPWGTVLGTDGAIYVTQGGNVPGSGDTSAVSGIQRVMPDGTVELIFSEVAGYELYGPNDLAFGPDGRLYFTESGSEQDFRISPAPFGPAANSAGEMLFE